MTDFEFDTAKAIKDQTYRGKIVEKEYSDDLPGYRVVFSKNRGVVSDKQNVGPFTTKAAAERVRDLVLEELNSEKELKHRIWSQEVEQRESHERYEAAQRKQTRELLKTVRAAIAREEIELQEGDVFLTPYSSTSWSGDRRWYDVKVVNGKLVAQKWGGEESKSAAVREAKEDDEHTGRILVIDKLGKVEWVRKGQKIVREKVGVWRVYHAKPNKGWGVTKTRMVRVKDDGRIVSHDYATTRKNSEPVEFETYDEAKAWVDAQDTNHYDRFTIDHVEKIVKKDEVNA